MIAWLLAFAAFTGASVTAALQIRRQRREIEDLSEQVLAMQNSFEQAVYQFGQSEACRGGDILDSIENDDYEMASNLGRLNLLLDQLSGLLHGGRDVGNDRRQAYYDEEWPVMQPGPIEFASPDELRKFTHLPPISDDDLDAADWELLFKRIQSDDVD